MSFQNADGQINTTVVDGTTYTGLYAADGSLNIVSNTSTSWLGLYHPCGAYNAVIITDPSSSYYNVNGSLNVILNTSGGYSPVQPAGFLNAPLTGGISFAGGYPLDGVAGVTYSSAFGVGALTSAWKTGPLFDVISPTSGTTTTIHAVGIGYPDVNTLANVLGVDPRTGIGGAAISTCYDQTGNNSNFTQASTTAGRRPMVWLINGNVSISLDGGLNVGVAHAFMDNTTASINNQSFSAFTSMTPFSDTGQINVGQFIIGGILVTGTGATDIAMVGPANTDTLGHFTPKTWMGYADFTNGIVQSVEPHAGIQPQVFSMVAGPTSVITSQNNLSFSTAAMVAGTHTGIRFGLDANDIFPAQGRFTSMLLSPSVFTTPQRTSLTSSIAGWSNVNLNINKTNPVNIVIDGASTDIGQGSVPGGGYQTLSGGGYGYCEELKDTYIAAGKQISWHNFAVSGASIADRTADYTSGFVQGSGFQSGSTKNILIAPGITVEVSLLAHSGDANATYTDFTTWLALAKSVAWTKIACILYPDATTAGMAAYNALMIANAASNGVDLIDGRTALLGVNVPPYANADGHPTVLGSSVYAAMIKTYLDTLV